MTPSTPLFGPVMQLGYVVPDLERAMRHWVSLGVGPFFVLPHVRFAETRYRGQPTEFDMSVGLAQWGEVQIELIQQYDEGPSIYRDFAYRATGGLQHVGVMTDSVDADLARLRPLGIESVQSGSTATGIKFAYVSTDLYPGAMVELIQHGTIDDFFKMVRQAAQGWDGRDPVRGL